MKIQAYDVFWQRIHKFAKNKGIPLRVMFELTYRCNFYCRHCYVPYSYRKYKELKTREVFSVLDQLADIGCFYLGFTGGEPFLRQDLMQILWHAKRKGFEIIIYTNGSLINEKIADELKRLRPNKVDITIPAMSKNAFERITQMPGLHKKVFNAIDFLYKRGVNLGFKSCVLRKNKEEIEDIQKFTDSLGALHRLDDMLSPCLDGSKEPYKYRRILKSKTNDQLPVTSKKEFEDRGLDSRFSAIDCQLNTENRKLNTEHFFKCGVGMSQAAITPSGELKMCLMIDYPKYKILKASLRGCWQDLKKLVGDIKPDGNYKCDRCRLKAYCKWCPARSWLNDRTFTSCDPENRRKAQLTKQFITAPPLVKT